MAWAVPYGFMHTVYINQFKALIKLWHSQFKGLTSDYVVPDMIWYIVGIEQGTLPRPFQLHSFIQFQILISISIASQPKIAVSGSPGWHHGSLPTISLNHITPTYSASSGSLRLALGLA